MKVLSLIERLDAQAAQAPAFLAPCVRGGVVTALVDGLVQRLVPHPSNFEGWGMFSSRNRVAQLVHPAHRRLVQRRMAPAPGAQLILVRRLRRSAWLAMPQHREAFVTRFGAAGPVVVQLVDGADQLSGVIARYIGGQFWFERVNRRAGARQITTLRAALHDWTETRALRLRGLTPEWRAAYDAALDWRLGAPARRAARIAQTDRDRLEHALRMGGGQLSSFLDRGDFWSVEWLDRDGFPQVSAISKTNLTVIDSGICLSGEDQNFDLHSLVGVYADAEF